MREAGLAALSIREVARRLGVSHQAPYKLFPSRDHLVAEIAGRAFAHFASFLDERPRGDDPRANLRALGTRYLAFAAAFPLEYQLMFGITLPDATLHPEMMRLAVHAFTILRECLRAEAAGRGVTLAGEEIDLEAMFVWSVMHGCASMANTSAGDALGFTADFHHRARERVFDRIDAALTAPLNGAQR